MIVTALDEVAWLFNLRGNDIPYTPVFRAYAIVDDKKAILYLPPEKHSFNVKEHLRSQVGYLIQYKEVQNLDENAWSWDIDDTLCKCFVFVLTGVLNWCR